jgi:hypothetical protein
MIRETLINSGYRLKQHSLSAFRANVLGFLLPVPLALIYIVLYALSFSYFPRIALPSLLSGRTLFVPLYFIAFFSALLVLSFLHELIHLFFFLIFSKEGRKSVTIGTRMLTPYAYSIEALSIGAYRLSMIAPFFLLLVPLGFLSFFLKDPFSFLITLIMIISTGGDWVSLWITRNYHGKKIYVWDHPDECSCEIYLPEPITDTPD